MLLLNIIKGDTLTFGEKLRKARKENKLSQDKLAELIGVSRVAITNYELSRNTPNFENIQKLTKVLNTEFGIEKNSIKLIPVIGTASCGIPNNNMSQEVNRTANYNGENWNKDLYCVIANGDSMSPEIDDGDEIIIDPNIKPVSGDMVYYKIYNESAVKVFVEDKESYLLQFIPYNMDDNFKTKTIRLDDEETVSNLTIHKVVSVNKLKYNNRKARLKLIGR